MSWSITIDQRTANGLQRYGPYTDDHISSICSAVEVALDRAGLLYVERGSYQITCTPVKETK